MSEQRTGTELERLDISEIEMTLTTKVMGRHIRYDYEVDSTQTVAHQLASEGAEEGMLVIAEQQSTGRGRLGRKWHSPAGQGIWMSLILKPLISVQLASQLTLLVSVALCRTIRRETAVDAGIKWPNDLLVAGKKISGILLEPNVEEQRLRYVIAGIGISVNLLQEDYPQELQAIATSLRMECGQRVDREQLICAFLQQFEELYTLYQEQGFTPIRLLWEALSVSLHHPIRVHTVQGLIEGIANSIDESGALIITLSDGTSVKLYSGDIVAPPYTE